MKFFEFYDLKPSFLIDEKVLKAIFLEKSKAFHPDFFINESEEKQQEILELSTYNTVVYNTLNDSRKRIAYILEQTGTINLEEKEAMLPQDFLMEMMEVNEKMMELELSFDEKSYQSIENEMATLDNELEKSIYPVLKDWKIENETSFEELKKVKEYFYKKKYLLRIQNSLNKFAPRLG